MASTCVPGLARTEVDEQLVDPEVVEAAVVVVVELGRLRIEAGEERGVGPAARQGRRTGPLEVRAEGQQAALAQAAKGRRGEGEASEERTRGGGERTLSRVVLRHRRVSCNVAPTSRGAVRS